MANVVEIILRGTDLTAPGFGGAITRMNAVGRAASGMFAIFAGGAAVGAVASLGALAMRSIEVADEMGKLAQKAGMPVEQFSQLAHSAKLADVSTSTLQSGIKKLSEEMVKAGRGGESVLLQMLAQADVFAKMEDGAEKTTLAVKLFGRSGQELIPLLNAGSDAIREQMQEADKLGLTISSDFAKQADEFGDNIDRIKAASGKFGKEVGHMLLPELVKLSEWAVDWVKEDGNALEQSINLLASMFAGLKQVIEDTGDALDALSRLALKFQIPGLSPRGSAAAPGITPSEIGAKVHPFGLPGIGMQDYGGAGFPGSDSTSAIVPGNEEKRQKELVAAAKAIAEAQRMYEQHSEWMRRLDERLEADKQRGRQATFDHSSRLLGMAAQLAATHGKKGFEAYRALALGEAIISTAAGVARAFKDHIYPYSAIVAGLVGAQGAIQIATIAGQKPPQAHGGLSSVPEDATYMLKAGERVLAPEQNTDFTEMLRTMRSGTEVYHVEVDSYPIFELIRQGSRDGRMQISARAIAT